MSKIIIGRFIPGNSVIHKMDSCGKLIFTFIFIFIVFLANNWQSYLALVLICSLAIVAIKMNLRFLWDGIKSLLGLIFFTSFLQLFFISGGEIYWKWGIPSVSSYGVINSTYTFLRLTLIILMSTVMTLTTAPLVIADAMGRMLKPLKYLHVPVAEIALIMPVVLRFVPTLFDQTIKIMNAQRSRRTDSNDDGLIKRIRAVVPLLVLLFINSLEVATDLSTAAEARGYRDSEGRSKCRVLERSKYDLTNLGHFVLLLILLLSFRSK